MDCNGYIMCIKNSLYASKTNVIYSPNGNELIRNCETEF